MTIQKSFFSFIALISTLALAERPSAAETPPLSNPVLRVEISPDNGALTVTDLRTKEQWHQARLDVDTAYQQKIVESDAAHGEWILECAMPGIRSDGKQAPASARISLKLHPSRPDLELVFQVTDTIGWREVRYPYSFVRDGEKVSNLYPHCEGMLVPARKTDPDWITLPDGDLYGGVHAYCMCLGLVDETKGQGVLTLLPDIEDTALRWREVSIESHAVSVPQLVCRASLGAFRRPWRVGFSFHDAGGYVSMSKRYRQFFAELGLHKTLTQKATENPAVSELAGTTVFWACGSQPFHALETADLLKSYGIDRCLLAMCNIPTRKPENAAYQEEMRNTIRHIRSLGYHVYRYDQYRDAFEPDPGKSHHHQINLEAWPDKLVIGRNGQRLSAFGPKSGVICPKFFLPLAKARFALEFSEHDYSAWFLDCLGSCGFSEGECHDPNHSTDRYECRREREALFQELKKHNKLAATECGIDYLLPHIHWAEGGSTLVRWVDSIHPRKVVENAGINDASHSKRPGVLAEMAKLPPKADAAKTISISTRFRIPFYSLCHHDEVVQTWRWEDGMEYPPVYWPLKNLWSVLTGSAPMYRIYINTARKYGEEMRRTHAYVNEWVRQVAFDEMTSHRFVTEDRQVQESEFSSGKGVVVNFGESPHTLPDGQTVKARDYVIFRAVNGGRIYSMPACPNVFAD